MVEDREGRRVVERDGDAAVVPLLERAAAFCMPLRASRSASPSSVLAIITATEVDPRCRG